VIAGAVQTHFGIGKYYEKSVKNRLYMEDNCQPALISKTSAGIFALYSSWRFGEFCINSFRAFSFGDG
jgi:hypothetical protein